MSLSASDLIVDDPGRGRVSFTRFVLPFAWEPDPKASEPEAKKCTFPGQATPPYFRPAKEGDWLHPAAIPGVDSERLPEVDTERFLDRSRRRYLTPETDVLLFTRARWLVLEDKNFAPANQIWRQFTVKSDFITDDSLITYTVALRPPGMILFEWPKEGQLEKGRDPLRIGFLIHEAFFPDPENAPGFADLLRFNEIFRYWRSPFDLFDKKYCRTELTSFREGVTHGFTVDGGGVAPCQDSPGDCYSNRWEDLLDLPVEDGKGGMRPIKPENDVKTSPLFPKWMVNPDDRAFTMPFAVLNRAKPGHLDHFAPFREADTSAEAHQGGVWAKLLNVDRATRWNAGQLGNSDAFEKKWARDRTYTRWAGGDWPTLYGFCEHSFAALCTEAAGVAPSDPPLGLHFGQMYFDSTLLHLYMKMGLFRFSKELHDITVQARDKEGSGNEIGAWRENFHELRWRFLQFQNLYRFPLFSNQQQHLEMYAYQIRAMDVKELYDEVEKEVQVSDEFLENELSSERNHLAGTLNVVAMVGLVGGLALGWMGAHEAQSGMRYFGALCLFGFVVVLVAALFSPLLERGVAKLSKLQRFQRLLYIAILVVAIPAAAVFLPRTFPALRNLFHPNPVEKNSEPLATVSATVHPPRNRAVGIVPPASTSAAPAQEKPTVASEPPASAPPPQVQ